MKIVDVKLKMKVVPHAKNAYILGLRNSVVWKMAKANNQPFLYVTGIERDGKTVMLNDEYKPTGDYFLVSDFKPYEE